MQGYQGKHDTTELCLHGPTKVAFAEEGPPVDFSP
jgi:hypothetical protein